MRKLDSLGGSAQQNRVSGSLAAVRPWQPSCLCETLSAANIMVDWRSGVKRGIVANKWSEGGDLQNTRDPHSWLHGSIFYTASFLYEIQFCFRPYIFEYKNQNLCNWHLIKHIAETGNFLILEIWDSIYIKEFSSFD